MDDIDSQNSTPGNMISEKLYSLLLRCSHALSRGEHQRGGMHPGQWRILSLLAANGAVAQRELLDIVQVRAASLSELLSKLENKGLITRAKGEGDKRNVLVELTELGEMVIAENAHNQRKTASELFALLSTEEQNKLAELLGKLVEAWHDRHHGNGQGHRCGDHDCRHKHGRYGENGSHGSHDGQHRGNGRIL